MGDTRQWRADEYGRPERDAGSYGRGHEFPCYPSDWAGDWDRDSERHRDRGWERDERPRPRREGGAHRAVLLSSVVAAGIVALGLVGAVAYVISPGTGTTQVAAPVAPSAAPAPAAISSPVAAAPTTETVTVRSTAPEVNADASAYGYSSYPSGADRSGWLYNTDARCNAGDPATIIGETTASSFSICTNPANGRFYYRGSSDGSGIEIDDPIVSGSTAEVVNGDVRYRISSDSMVIIKGLGVLSQQSMIEFWAR